MSRFTAVHRISFLWWDGDHDAWVVPCYKHHCAPIREKSVHNVHVCNHVIGFPITEKLWQHCHPILINHQQRETEIEQDRGVEGTVGKHKDAVCVRVWWCYTPLTPLSDHALQLQVLQWTWNHTVKHLSRGWQRDYSELYQTRKTSQPSSLRRAKY